MGGNAFGVAAQQLPQTQYDLLKEHVLKALGPLTELIETPRHFRSKTDHGDLDVLFGYSTLVSGGDEEWVPNSETAGPKSVSEDMPTIIPDPILEEIITKLDIKPADKLETTLTNLSGSNHGGQITIHGTGKMVSGKDVEDVRELCGKMRKCIGATAWRRRGPEVSFRVPCSVIDEVAAPLEGMVEKRDKFYQVDVLFMPPDNVEFNHMMASYSCTGLLFGRILRILSNSFTVHLTHFIVRHSPFFGLPPIDITLTTSPSDFCEWLGLDYKVWKDAGDTWVEEQDLYKWMTTAKEDSLAVRTFRRMAARSKTRITEDSGSKKNKRAGFVDRFQDWLKSQTEWATRVDPAESAKVDPKESIKVEPEESTKVAPNEPTGENNSKEGSTPVSSTPISSPSQNGTPAPAQTPSTEKPMLTSDVAAIPTLPIPLSNNTDKRALVDPDQPRPLDSRVTAAMDFWNKQETYDNILEERRILARTLAERQRERMESREKSAEDQIKYETEVKDW